MFQIWSACLLLLCWITRPALAVNDQHQEGEDLASVLTIFKETMKLAKSAASGECFCSNSKQVSYDFDRKNRILDLIQKLNELVDREEFRSSSFRHHHATTNMDHSDSNKEQRRNKRVKRFIHFGFRRRIAFPPGTKLSVTPTLYLPFVRDLPDGLISNMSFNFPFSIFLDKLGLTDESNIFGTFPIIRHIFHLLFGHRRTKRASDYTGGHRMLIYHTIENVLYNFGMEGHQCLLRAICEIHEFPLDHHHGLLGELLQFLFTASKSPDAGEEGLDYIRAEQSGRDRGECRSYYSKCPRSLFSQQDDDDNTLYM